MSDRRDFLKTTALLGAAGMVTSNVTAKELAQQKGAEGVKSYRRLGRTELMISDISFGTSRLQRGQEHLIDHALDRGVNYFDSAEGYTRGQSEQVIGNALKGKRDKAILAVLLYHGLRREELCRLTVRDLHERTGVRHFRVLGKGDKIRFVPAHPLAQRLIEDYLAFAGHGDDAKGPLFRPVRNNATAEGLARPLNPSSIYREVVRRYAVTAGITGDLQNFGPHAMRATAATNALSHDADIAKVQEWLGHANVSTTRLYDRRKTRPEESPTFRVKY